MPDLPALNADEARRAALYAGQETRREATQRALDARLGRGGYAMPNKPKTPPPANEPAPANPPTTGEAADLPVVAPVVAPLVAPVGVPTKMQTTDEDVRRAVQGDKGAHPLEIANERGLIGTPADPTPNEAYTLAGRVEQQPTPETDPGAWAAANAPARFPAGLVEPANPNPLVPAEPGGRLYSADNPNRAADVAAGRDPFALAPAPEPAAPSEAAPGEGAPTEEPNK